jgi:hypothetical protein
MLIIDTVKGYLTHQENYFSIGAEERQRNAAAVAQATACAPFLEETLAPIELQGLLEYLSMNNVPVNTAQTSSFVMDNGFTLAVNGECDSQYVAMRIKAYLYHINLNCELKSMSQAWQSLVLVFKTLPVVGALALDGYKSEYRLRESHNDILIEYSYLIQNKRTGEIHVHWTRQETSKNYPSTGFK